MSTHFGFNNGNKNRTGKTPIFVDNRVVGEVVGERFIKRVYASRHFLRRPPAIANDVMALEQAKKAGARVVVVVDRESGRHYRAGIQDVLDNGLRLNRGYGDQVALPLDKWTVEGPGEPRQMSLV